MPVIVDAHHHLWDLTHRYEWLDASSLAPIRRTFGVDDLRAVVGPAGVWRTVLVEAGRCDTAEASELLATAAATDEIASVVAWVDVSAPDLPDVLDRYRSGTGGDLLVGVRSQVQDEPDSDYLRRADVQRGLATIAAADLTFDLVVRADQLPSAAAAVNAVPDGRFVLDHLGKPRIADGQLDEWREALAPLAAMPNVYAKLSGLTTEAEWSSWTVADLRPYVETALELFGPERLLFGSDWPVCLLAASYDRVVAATDELIDALSASEQAAVWAASATAAYQLRV